MSDIDLGGTLNGGIVATVRDLIPEGWPDDLPHVADGADLAPDAGEAIGAPGDADVDRPAEEAPGGAPDGPQAELTYEDDHPGEEPDDEGEDVANDYAIKGPPSISLETFAAVLRNAGSPAAGEAAGMYAAAVQYGVDPAVLLAIFHKESNYGKAGIAVGRNNGFGLLWYSSYADLGHNKGGWAAFDTWTKNAQAASRLLASSSYGGSSKYRTARTFPFRWAPTSDGNAPGKYGRQLVAFINGLGGTPNATSTAPAPKPSALHPHHKPVRKPSKGTKAHVPRVGPVTPPPPTLAGSGLGSPQGSGLAIGSGLPTGAGTLIIVGGAVLLVLVLAIALRDRRGQSGSEG